MDLRQGGFAAEKWRQPQEAETGHDEVSQDVVDGEQKEEYAGEELLRVSHRKAHYRGRVGF